jgi:hypothetical protein
MKKYFWNLIPDLVIKTFLFLFPPAVVIDEDFNLVPKIDRTSILPDKKLPPEKTLLQELKNELKKDNENYKKQKLLFLDIGLKNFN